MIVLCLGEMEVKGRMVSQGAAEQGRTSALACGPLAFLITYLLKNLIYIQHIITILCGICCKVKEQDQFRVKQWGSRTPLLKVQKEVVITAGCPTDVADEPSDILCFPGYVSRNER